MQKNVVKQKGSISSKHNKSKKRTKKIIVILTIIFTIVGILIYTDYIPLFYEIKKPVGNYEEIKLENMVDDFPDLADMPNLENINYKTFKTDETSSNIENGYKSQLENEGFNLEYEDYIYHNDNEYKVLGFLKGLKAVGIIITEDSDQISEFSKVLYSTGNALDFKEILDWYKNK